MRKTPKKAIHPLAYEHDTVLQAIGGVFSAKPTFVRATRGKPAIGDGVLWTTCKRGEAERSLEKAAAGALSLGGSVVASHHR